MNREEKRRTMGLRWRGEERRGGREEEDEEVNITGMEADASFGSRTTGQFGCTSTMDVFCTLYTGTIKYVLLWVTLSSYSYSHSITQAQPVSRIKIEKHTK